MNQIKIWQHFGFIYQQSPVIIWDNFQCQVPSPRQALSLPAAEEVSRAELSFLLHLQFEEHVIFHFWKEVKAVTDSVVLVST